MEILHFSAQQDFPSYGLRLSFEETLCPFAGILPIEVNNGQGLNFSITIVASSGIVYVVKLPVSMELWSNVVLSNSSLMVRDLSSEFSRLHEVTSFTVARNILFVGGRNGSVLCFSLFTDPGQDICYELKGGDAGIGRLWGLVTRNKSVPSVMSLGLQEFHGKTVLLALHEDGTLQAWDPLQHFRLFSHNICPSPELTGSSALALWTEDGVFGSSKRIAVVFTDASLVKTRNTICIYSMEPLASSGLQLGAPTLQQVVPIDQGAIVDVKLVQGDLWLLNHSVDSYELMHLKLQLGVLPQHYLLQENKINEQLVVGEGSDLRSLPIEASVTKLLMRRLLQPGIFHHETAQYILQERGVYVGDSSLRTLLEDDWRRDISLAINKAGDGTGTMDEWNSFVSDYSRLWRKNHIPYALFADATSGCVGLVRKSSFSLIRSRSSVERTWTLGEGKDSEVLTGLLACMQLVICHLGQLPLAAFDESLLQRKGPSVNELVSTLVHNLDVGFQSHRDSSIGIDAVREKEKQRHSKQRLFNFKICQELRTIKDIAGNWGSILDTIANYEKFLLFGSTQKFCRIPAMGNVFTKLITHATSQVLWAHFQECRSLVIFLSYVINLKSQIHITASDASRIQLQMLPRLKKAMLINIFLYWLSVTPGEAPDSNDFNSLLASLRIDGATANSTWKGNLGFGQFTLGEILAASFFDEAPVTFRHHSGAFVEKGDLLDYTRGFITWLSLGKDTRLNFPRRIIALSRILLQNCQYRNLENFLSIVERFANDQTYLNELLDADSDCSARLHLHGFCLLARACSGDVSNKSQQIKDAASCFFRAAAALQDSSEIFHSYFTGVQHERTAASWKLHYFEWVMQIFEQYNLSEGASQFALAALDQVDKTGSDMGIKGRLWANVFKFSMDLNLFGDAYTAIISNPDEEVKLTCLRRFVVLLCERKATQVLCGGGLPYSGLIDTVEQELAWKAEYSDVSAKPNVYKVLFAFHLYHRNYRRAAGYMYRYAVRMRDEGISKSRLQVAVALQEQVNGLAAAISMLSLVSPSSAWIDLEFTSSNMLPSSSPAKRFRLTGSTGSDNNADVKEDNVVDVEELERQYVIAVAKLDLVHASVSHPTIGALSPAMVVHLLVQNGIYESAFSTVFRLWKGSRLERELEKIFELIARNCCSQQTSIRPPNGMLLMLTGVDSPDSTLPSTSKGDWYSLQLNLEKYRIVHPRLPVVVAEAILSVNKNMELPLWLVDLIKGGKSATPFGMAEENGDPAALLRIYVDNGRLTEASVLILDYLRAWANMRPADIIKRKKMSAAWFPYALIDRLQQSLSECSNSDSRCKEMMEMIKAAVERHVTQMREDADDIASTQA